MPKTIHLIRHAQSTFNAAQAATGLDPLHFDARLSPFGLSQLEQTRATVRDIPCDVVIASPLTRALQTAVGLFGGRAPIRVEPLHREYQESSCDMGRSPRLLATEFPDLAFDHLDDPWWLHQSPDANGIVVEPIPDFQARVARFRSWLAAQPEDSIVVIGHGTFFRHLTGRTLANCEVVAWQPD
jgi:broad specificity phosphatase PhoE